MIRHRSPHGLVFKTIHLPLYVLWSDLVRSSMTDSLSRSAHGLLSESSNFERSHVHAVLIRFIAGAVIPFVFDTVVITLTMNKTLSQAAEMHRMRLAGGITQLLLRDGKLVLLGGPNHSPSLYSR